jgi:hypothetical protein
MYMPCGRRNNNSPVTANRHPSPRVFGYLLFWTTTDFENKLLDFRTYFNNHRTHTSREGRTPDTPDQSQISGRLDGSPIVDPYFRPQWLPNF